MKDFEKEIIKTLEEQDITVSKYFGELANPDRVQIDIKKLPFIYVDYVGCNIDKLINKHKFSLYIAHLSFSKNIQTRSKKHYEIYDLLNEVRHKLNFKCFSNSEPIDIKNIDKIYDQTTDLGYLTVFRLDFDVVIREQY